MRPKNLKDIATHKKIINAKNQKLDIDYLQTDLINSLKDNNYIILNKDHENAKLLDYNQQEFFDLPFKKYNSFYISPDLDGNWISDYHAIDWNDEQNISLKTFKQFIDYNKLSDVNIQEGYYLRNRFSLFNKTFEIPLYILVEYHQDFFIPAGQIQSDIFEIISNMTEYDNKQYLKLNEDTVNNINDLNINMRPNFSLHKLTYTGLNGKEYQANDKFICNMDKTVSFDIKGTIRSYNEFILPIGYNYIDIPVIRYKDIYNFSNHLQIKNISTGKFNVIDIKDELILHNENNILKKYHKITPYINNNKVLDKDLKLEIETVKNLYIPKNETKATYELSLVNLLPNLNTDTDNIVMNNTSIFNGDIELVVENEFSLPETIEPDVNYTSSYDPKAKINPNEFQIQVNNYNLEITDLGSKIKYELNISENNSILKLYKMVGSSPNKSTDQLLAEALIDQNGNCTIQPLDVLPDGEHNIYFTILSSQELESIPSPIFNFKIDTNKPKTFISGYYIDQLDTILSNIKSFETISKLFRYQNIGATNNPKPILIGFTNEPGEVLIYNNGSFIGKTISVKDNNIYNDERIGDIESGYKEYYSFIYINHNNYLKTGMNNISYQLVDNNGNYSDITFLTSLEYKLVDIGPQIYILDDSGFKIEVLNNEDGVSYTDDNTPIFFGTGVKNKTKVKISIKGDNSPDIFINEVYVSKNSWKLETSKLENSIKSNIYNPNLPNTINTYIFELKDINGIYHKIEKTLNIVNKNYQVNNISCDINIADNKVYFTFNEPIFDFYLNDIEITGGYLENLKLSDINNNIYEADIIYNENYSNDKNCYIKLKKDSIYNKLGLSNNEFSHNYILTATILPNRIRNHNFTPLTPYITLKAEDNTFSSLQLLPKIIKNGDTTDDPRPKFYATNLGSWVEDTLINLFLTRSISIENNKNFKNEYITYSPYDKLRTKILNILTESDNIINNSFSYLKKDNLFFDSVYYKDNNGNFIFPYYDIEGKLYIKKIEIQKSYNALGNIVYNTIEQLQYLDNYEEDIISKDIIINRFFGIDKFGEVTLRSLEEEEPITTYQVITNNSSPFDRNNIVKIERYLIIFKNQNSVTYNFKISNPLGLGILETKYYNEDFILNYDPIKESDINELTELPNFVNHEIININILPIGYKVLLEKSNHTPTLSNPAYYKLKLVNEVGLQVDNLNYPIICKLNMYYDLTIPANEQVSKKLRLPIKRYNHVDTSNILSFSWLKFNIINTSYELNNDYYVYTLNRKYNHNLWDIKIRYNCSVLFLSNQEYMIYDFDSSIEILSESIKIIDINGIPFNNQFDIEHILNPDTGKLNIKINKKSQYFDLDIKDINIQLQFDILLSFNTNNKKIYIKNINQKAAFFKILNIVPPTGVEESYFNELLANENILIHEYFNDYIIEQERIIGEEFLDQSPYPNNQSAISELDNIKKFQEVYDKSFFEVIPIHHPGNNYLKFYNFLPNEVIHNNINTQHVNINDPIDYKDIAIGYKKEQRVVYDLRYYGLQNSCIFYYDSENDKYLIKAIDTIILNNKFFEEDNSYIDYNNIDENDSHLYSDTYNNYNINRRPPDKIWIHLDDSNQPSLWNNADQSLIGENSFYDIKGKYITWEWYPEASSGFYIQDNLLDTLKTKSGNPLPKIIKGVFNCSNNKLIDLDGGPEIVYGHYLAKNNKLTSLFGLAKQIGGLSKTVNINELIKLGNISPTNWINYLNSFNDDDNMQYNNNIIVNNMVGSNLDLSFNSLNENSILNLSDNYDKYGYLGWNIFIANNNFNYTDINYLINIIKLKFDIVGLIFTEWDQVNFKYILPTYDGITQLPNTNNEVNPNTMNIYYKEKNSGNYIYSDYQQKLILNNSLFNKLDKNYITLETDYEDPIT